MLTLVFYFFAFGCLANGLLQTIKSSDLVLVVEHGFNPIYSYILAAILGILIIYQLFIFKDMLKIVEPSTDKRIIKTLSIIWFILVTLYFVVYFSLGFISKLFF